MAESTPSVVTHPQIFQHLVKRERFLREHSQPILVVDRIGTIKYANPQTSFDIGGPEGVDHLVGKSVADIFVTAPTSDLYKLTKATLRASRQIASKTPSSRRDLPVVEIQTAAGDTRYIQIVPRPIPDIVNTGSRSRTLGFEIECFDVTELERKKQLAQLFQETAEALMRKTELNEIYETIQKQLFHVVPYESANLLLINDRDEVTFNISWSVNHDQKSPIISLHHPSVTSIQGMPIFERMKQLKEPIVIPDISKDERWRDTNPEIKIASYIGVPLVLGDRVVGFLSLNSDRSHAFNPEQGPIVQTFAAQIANAIDRASLFEELKTRSETDPLTGLANRRAFTQMLTHEVTRSQRERSPLSLLLLDVDQFKLFNDTYGHPAGDERLKDFANVLRDSIRSLDYPGRWGGEEFGVVLPSSDKEAVEAVALRILESVREKFADSEIYGKTVSIGVATFAENDLPTKDFDASALVNYTQKLYVLSDTALYEAKKEVEIKSCILARWRNNSESKCMVKIFPHFLVDYFSAFSSSLRIVEASLLPLSSRIA